MHMSMLDQLTLLSAVGCGLLAGFFFAFSICVMKALARLPPAHGVAAMQSINVVVINPWFLTAFFGTAAACAFVTIGAFVQRPVPGGPLLIAGGVLYLVGAILVTALFNVPRNNALAAVAPSSPEAAGLWAAYLSTWTAWNHVRTIASLAAALLLSAALRVRP